MKIAVAKEGNMVAQHFGHCEGFEIFTEEAGKIVYKKFYENPGHKPGFLPNYLNDLGVNVIIAGGMGGGAIEIFNEKNIEVIVGASGDTALNVENYLKGKLKSMGSICHQHAHADSCGEH